MVRLRHLLPLIMSACLLFPVSGAASGLHTVWGAERTEAQPAAEAAQSTAEAAQPAAEAARSQPPTSRQLPSSPQDQVIRYSDLQALVTAFSPQVQMAKTQYDSRLDRYEAAKDEIMETRRHLLNEAENMEKNGDSEGAGNYRKQAKVLEKSARNMDKQLRSLKGSQSTQSLRRMEDTMTWTAQNLMGTYNSLRAAQEGAEAQSELMAGKHEKAVRQVGLGMVSQAQADEAEKAAAAAAGKAVSLKNELEGIRKEILMVTGYPVDSQVQIDSMPSPDPARVDKFDLEVDKWRAMGNNYGLRQQRGSSGGGSMKERHSRQRAIEESEAGLYGQMDTLYQSMLASRTSWQSACTAQEAREAEWKAASNKKNLGMLSDQDYLEAKAAYLNGTAEKAQADVNFQQAMDTYDWAVKGLVKAQG